MCSAGSSLQQVAPTFESRTGHSGSKVRKRLLFVVPVWATVCGSFPFQMLAVLLVFAAEHFEDVVIGHESVRYLDSKGFRIHFGIIKRDLVIQVSEIAPMETLNDVQ